MGTVYSVKYVPIGSVSQQKIQEEVEAILRDVNKQMSTYMPGSEIGKLNRQYAGEPMLVSSWFAQVLTFSLDLAKSTDGLFDPTIGPLVNLWGFGPGGERKVPEEFKVKELQEYVGYKKIKLRPDTGGKWFISKSDPRVQLDLSASAKGFAVDKISDHLSLRGLVNHLVDIGGELKARGSKKTEPWVVAVEKPSVETGVAPGVQLFFPIKNMAIATSGSYHNFFNEGGVRYSHTIDPTTGRPILHDLVSVTVLDESCMKADGLATALMAMGPKKAWEYAIKNKLAAYLITASLPSKKQPKKQTSSMEDDIIVKTKGTPAFNKLTANAALKVPESK